MKRLVLAGLTSVALLASAPAHAAQAPALSGTEAWLYTHDALDRKFDAAFESGDGYSGRCSKRLNRSAVRCRPSWFIGDLSYFGKVTVRYRVRASGKVKATVTGRIIEFNEFCAAVEEGTRDECLDKIKVRESLGAIYD